jgi:hypothetical protein
MGKHSPPIDGTVANGHALEPFTLPLRPRGPVSVLPSRTVPDRPRLSRIDGDTAIRVLAAIVVLAVAAFAAVVSYSHIFELGRHHGQDGTAARLLPLSVDGLIAAASLVMLHAARRSQSVPSLARAMLALGVAATIAANIFYGLPFGWLAAVVSAWPAVAFVGSVEMAVRFVRDARQGDNDTTGDTTQADKLAAGLPATTPPVTSGDGSALTRRSRPPELGKSRVVKLSVEAEAARAGVSVRTIQRRRAKDRSRT